MENIREFFVQVYKPWVKAQMRPSTFDSYVHIWNKYLDAEIGWRRIEEYKTAEATRFLTSLAHSLGRNTVSHIRASMSAIFSHAVALGHCPSNPIRGAKSLAKAKPCPPRHHSVRRGAGQPVRVCEGTKAVMLATKQAAMAVRNGKEPSPVEESRVRVALYLLWRTNPRISEEELARKSDRSVKWVRWMIENGFPLLG